MKRLTSICVLLLMILSFAGCDILPVLKPDSGTPTQNPETLNQGVEETDPVVEPTQGIVEDQVFDDGSIRIDSETQYKLNLFLSNFAEAQIKEYPCCDYHKLKFVQDHCQINGVGELDYADNNVHFSKATADSILNTYVGTVIVESGEYKEYSDCAGSGAVITFSENSYSGVSDGAKTAVYVAVAERLHPEADGTYTVKYRVYSLDPDFTSYDYSAIYAYTLDEAIYDWNLSEVYRAEAVVRDYVRSGGQKSYQLISLKEA